MWPLSKGLKHVLTRTPMKGRDSDVDYRGNARNRREAAVVGESKRSVVTNAAAVDPLGVASRAPTNARVKRDKTVMEIEKLRQRRIERRKSQKEFKRHRMKEKRANEKAGRPGDVDFQRMIRKFRNDGLPERMKHKSSKRTRINIAVRVRPVNAKEKSFKRFEAVTCHNPRVFVHSCKFRVDGITKTMETDKFIFDNTFGPECTNDDIYSYTAKHLVRFVCSGGNATCFAFGETGSGKTYTMAGIQRLTAHDIFRYVDGRRIHGDGLSVSVSFFELYGGRCLDLLNHRHKLSILEDAAGKVVGLKEEITEDVAQLLGFVTAANRRRTTHATDVHKDSSRSHAICRIRLRSGSGEIVGTLCLIDLAGSERASNTKNHNRQRRVEGAEINKSLLALKECIRALDNPKQTHIPFRASKLTLVLKDSFTGTSRCVMVSCISPTSDSTNHTLNTLRYADRVKEKKSVGPDDFEDTGSPGRLTMKELEGKTKNTGSSALQKLSSGRAIPLSPTASRLHKASRLAKQGAISQAAKARMKADILKGVGRGGRKDARGPPCPPVIGSSGDSGVDAMSSSRAEADLQILHQSLHVSGSFPVFGGEKEHSDCARELLDVHTAVQRLIEEEESLLNAHMLTIQENAQLLTREGHLLSSIQGDDVIDYDIDLYAAQLDQILERKMEMISSLQRQLRQFRTQLQEEERASRRLDDRAFPLY